VGTGVRSWYKQSSRCTLRASQLESGWVGGWVGAVGMQASFERGCGIFSGQVGMGPCECGSVGMQRSCGGVAQDASFLITTNDPASQRCGRPGWLVGGVGWVCGLGSCGRAGAGLWSWLVLWVAVGLDGAVDKGLAV
jgi:hypothetical protein